MRREWMTPILAGLSALIGGCAMAAHTLEAGALPPGAGYVAMGSSYASGPGVATWSGDGPPACARSVQSYSRQLARLRGLTLTDRSCSGAITPHILVGGQAGQPPQLDGLSADIRLVTVTIGGNDVRYTADSNQWTCLNLPSAQRAAPCPTGAPLDAEPA